MKVPKELVDQWRDEWWNAESSQELRLFEYVAYRAAEWALSQSVSMEHVTDGSPCWCNPDIIEEDNGNVIIHNYEDNWQQYAKPGETAQQCIERHRAEQDALMTLYAQAPEPVSMEPVAWRDKHNKFDLYVSNINQLDAEPLYTAAQLAQARQQGAEEAGKWKTMYSNAMDVNTNQRQRIAELEKSNAVLPKRIEAIADTDCAYAYADGWNAAIQAAEVKP